MTRDTNPHATTPTRTLGAPLGQARAAVVMLHGRGSSADDILSLARYLRTEGVAFLAPQAQANTWYPHRFIVPRANNEPWLSSALNRVGGVLKTVSESSIPPEKTLLLGFSQGACLAVEYAALNPQRYGGVAVLSGGLIGEEGVPLPHADHQPADALAGTPVFMGCSDVDFHIPVERVHESAQVLARMGAQVDKRIYHGMGHTINEDEIMAVQALISALM